MFRQPGCFRIDGAPWLAVAVGVATNPEPRPPVIMSNGTSRNFKRPDFVTDGFQVRRHLLERQSVKVSNVLAKDPSGPDFRHKAEHFRPEETVVIDAGASCLGWQN